MNDQVEEVKQKTDIVGVIGQRVELKKAGSKFKGLCPFHSEKTPSFIVSPELQIYKCFGCGKSGDVFTFLEDYEGMDFSEALKTLAQKAGVDLKPLKGFKTGARERMLEINSNVANFYHYVLTKHPGGKVALNYLKKDRGLTMDTIEKFNLGFSPDRDLAMMKYIVERKKVTIRELEDAGIVYTRNGRTFDRFRGRVIFPLTDHRGNIVGFAGRIMPSNTNKELAKYINTPETLVYHKSKVLFGLNETRSEIKKLNEAIIVEGELDMLSSWQVGIKNIVAIKGSALTEEQAKLLSRFCKKVILMLDADFAGNEAARRGIVIAEKEGLEISVARLKGYKDPDEAARGDPDLLKKAVKDPEGVWDFIIDMVFAKYKGQTGEEKFRISRDLTPILATIENKIVQAHYIAKVANLLHVPVEAVMSEVNNIKVAKKEIGLTEELVTKSQSKTRSELLEERLLTIIFWLDPKKLMKKGFLKIFKSPFAHKVVESYLESSKEGGLTLRAYVKKLPPELKEGFTDIVLADVKGLGEANEERLESEIKLIEREIKILSLKAKLEDITAEISTLEEKKDNKMKVKQKEREFSALTRKLFELEGSNIKGIIL